MQMLGKDVSQLALYAVLLLMMHSAVIATLNPVSVPGNGKVETCPAQESRDAVIQNISSSVETILQTKLTTQNLTVAVSSNCGAGQWYRIAHLNMSNSSQQCPVAWREYSTSGVRACGRPEISSGSCVPTLYATSRQYSKVCGRIIGYQIGSTDAFGLVAVDQTIDSYYVYGVSVTHGTPRNHIWTLAAGLSERAYSRRDVNCPCSNPGDPSNALPPSFVGNNYYCESGNPADSFIGYHLYSSDPLWDGKQCEGQCCSNGKSPPWFSVELSNSTIDDIEVRICVAQESIDDVAIELLELYVQ